MKREDWTIYAGAKFPRITKESVFFTRPWDDGKLTPEQKIIMVKRRRKILLES